MTKINELNFREMYHEVCFISLNESIKRTAHGDFFNGEESANGILAYGYVDWEAGFTFEMLSWANCDESGEISAFEGNEQISIKFRRGSVSDCEIIVLYEVECPQYQSKIQIINDRYKYSEGIETTRKFEFIDSCRNENYPDDVLVYVLSEGKRPEGCWVRCTGTNDIVNKIEGILLNEPDQNFGIHCNDTVLFGIVSQEDGNVCVAEL